jgi:hypothetical protein
MTALAINDLSMDKALDQAAMSDINGGATYNYTKISNVYYRRSRRFIGFAWTSRGLKRKYQWNSTYRRTYTTYKGWVQYV